MTKVMTFGAFDVIHEGHRSLFKQAKRIAGSGAKLYVVVASDARIKKVKGKKPWYSQKQRMEHLRKEEIVDAVIQGDKLNTLRPILHYKPEIIVLGYDQPLKPGELKHQLKRHHFTPKKIVRAKAFKAHKFKSSILKKKIKKG